MSATGKREGYLSWDDYFMSLAFLSGMRSKDPQTQVGACVVNKLKRIVGIGYNGFPDGCSDDTLPWGKDKENPLNDKGFYVCHAEMNAILNKNSADVRGCTLYTGLFPCSDCAKIIIQAGISKVIYYSDKKSEKETYQAAKSMFNLAGVKYRQYRPEREEIPIIFRKIEENP